MRISILMLLALSLQFAVSAQQYVTTGDFDRLSKASFGVGVNTYFGELRKAADPKLQLGLSSSLAYEHLFTDKIAIRVGFSVYNIHADDSLSERPEDNIRNLNFKATNVEFVVQALYHLYPHKASGYKDRALINPYVHLGVGVTSNNPKAELAGTTYDLRPLSLEGVQYGGLAMVIPMGLGANFFLSRNWDLQVEMQYSLALTGYLDDVSSVYRDPASFSDTNNVDATTMGLLSDPRAALSPPVPPVAAGTARGDGSNDSYLRFGVKLAYYLPKSLYGKSSIRCQIAKRTR